MALIEEALWTRLQAVAGLTALVGTRVYARGEIPQEPTFPMVSFWRVSGPREESLSGSSGAAYPRVQFDVWAADYLGAKQVAEEVRLALQGFSGTVDSLVIQGISFVGDTDLPYDPEVRAFHVAADYEVRHEEPKP